MVPVSATSGVVPPAIAVTNRSWASAHSTYSTLRVAPVSSLNALATSAKKGSESGLVPFMIQTSSVFPLPEPESSSPPPEQAARVSVRTVAAAAIG